MFVSRLFLLFTPFALSLSTDYASQWLLKCRWSDEHQLKSLLHRIDDLGQDLWTEHHPELDPDQLLIIRVDREGRDRLMKEFGEEVCGLSVRMEDIFEMERGEGGLWKWRERRLWYDKGTESKKAGLEAKSTGHVATSSGNKLTTQSKFFDDYRSSEEINKRLHEWQRLYTERVKELALIGKSVEGRPLYALHITTSGTRRKGKDGKEESAVKSKCFNQQKQLIWVSAGQHAREWISPSSAMFLANYLLTSASEPRVQYLLDNFEIVICPLINPDGYEYSRLKDRMWRKNRRANSDGSYGTDLNRNWDDYWGQEGSSKSPGSAVYHGTGPASEPEVRNLQDYILKQENRLLGFDLHSFSQLVLRNYGRTKERCPREPMAKDLGDAMANHILSTTGAHYQSNVSAGLAVTTGSHDDWFYDKADMLGYTIELRDKGRYGFVLPKEQIVDTGMDVVAVILRAGERVLEPDFPCIPFKNNSTTKKS